MSPLSSLSDVPTWIRWTKRADLTTDIEENTTHRTKIQDANKMLIQDITAVVLSFYNRPIPSTETRFTPKPLVLKENFWKQDENAKYGKEICIAVIDYGIYVERLDIFFVRHHHLPPAFALA